VKHKIVDRDVVLKVEVQLHILKDDLRKMDDDFYDKFVDAAIEKLEGVIDCATDAEADKIEGISCEYTVEGWSI